jgi:hypothetical protein
MRKNTKNLKNTENTHTQKKEKCRKYKDNSKYLVQKKKIIRNLIQIRQGHKNADEP